MLQLQQIYKTFQGQEQPTLQGIDLTLKKGEFCILLGGNGSGKSTLMASILGEHSIDAGRILLDQKDITQLSTQQRATFMASVAQDTYRGTIPEMTLLENMVLSLKRGQKGSFSFYQGYQVMIEQHLRQMNLGLERYLSVPLRTLSGGQRQVIATMMALYSRPQLLLLDEHTSALDPGRQQELMKYTARAVENLKITTVMVTHHLKDALHYGNRVIMLQQGKIVLDIANEKKQALTQDMLRQHYIQTFGQGANYGG